MSAKMPLNKTNLSRVNTSLQKPQITELSQKINDGASVNAI